MKWVMAAGLEDANNKLETLKNQYPTLFQQIQAIKMILKRDFLLFSLLTLRFKKPDKHFW